MLCSPKCYQVLLRMPGSHSARGYSTRIAKRDKPFQRRAGNQLLTSTRKHSLPVTPQRYRVGVRMRHDKGLKHEKTRTGPKRLGITAWPSYGIGRATALPCMGKACCVRSDLGNRKQQLYDTTAWVHHAFRMANNTESTNLYFNSQTSQTWLAWQSLIGITGAPGAAKG